MSVRLFSIVLAVLLASPVLAQEGIPRPPSPAGTGNTRTTLNAGNPNGVVTCLEDAGRHQVIDTTTGITWYCPTGGTSGTTWTMTRAEPRSDQVDAVNEALAMTPVTPTSVVGQEGKVTQQEINEGIRNLFADTLRDLSARAQLTLTDFDNQPCSSTRCPDPFGHWVFNLWAYLARVPAMRPDRGTNTTLAWDASVDSQNDMVTTNVQPASAYTFVLPNSEAAWQTTNVDVPQGAGAVLCRNSGSPFAACTSGGSCGSIPALGYHEMLTIRKVPENRYYLATAQEVANCSAAAAKILTLADAWPVATDSNDEIQPFMPDGGHVGEFGTRFLLQQLLEARQEFWFEPVENLIRNGRMELSCATGGNGWTASAGTLTAGSYNAIGWDAGGANNVGSVVSGSCRWTATVLGDTLLSDAINVEAGGTYFIRWFQRTLGTSSALGLRLLYDSDANGTYDADVCGAYPSGACAQPASAWHIDHPDLIAIAPTDPDAGGAMPTAFYPNDNGVAAPDAKWCGDWCWNLLRIRIPDGVRSVKIQFVVEGSTNATIDELVMFPALKGVPDGQGMTWLIPPGEQRWVATGDSRCDDAYGSWADAMPVVMETVKRPGLFVKFTDICVPGQETRYDLTKGVGCTDTGCGGTSANGQNYEGQPNASIPASGLKPTKVYPSLVTTFLGENDAKALSATGGVIASFVAGAVDETNLTTLSATLTSGSGTVTVSSTTGFPAKGGRLLVGDEMISYTTTTATTFTGVSRGLSGTLAEQHEIGATVKNVSLHTLIRRNGAKHIWIASHPWRGSTDGTDTKCNADGSAEDCSEWLQLATKALIERAH